MSEPGQDVEAQARALARKEAKLASVGCTAMMGEHPEGACLDCIEAAILSALQAAQAEAERRAQEKDKEIERLTDNLMDCESYMAEKNE